MIERKQDYQLTIPVVPPGGVQNVPLQLDTDAPFSLRLIQSRNIGLNGWRFQTPKKLWQSNGLRTDVMVPMSPGAGYYPSRGAMVYPEIVYPAGTQIVVDVGNATDSDIINARLLFRGVKRFADGSMLAPSYPDRFAVLPFGYQTVVPGVGLAASASLPFVASAQLQIKESTDFVFRYGVCDPYAVITEGGILPPGFSVIAGTLAGLPNFTELYVQMRDESRKPYSNEPIHINDLFGQAVPSTLGTDGGANTNYTGAGPTFPGLIIPELYLKRNTSIYFDLYRYDLTGSPVDLYFRFMGAKVTAQ